MTSDLGGRIRARRHRLHLHPETGFAERDRNAFVAGTLVGLGLEVARGAGGTGVVASLTRSSGARAMPADGLLDRFPVEAVHGLPDLPGVPAGHLFTRSGAIMAGDDSFEIAVTGGAGRGGTPLPSHDHGFDDDILDVGVHVYATLVRDVLPDGGTA
jgi:metal-dependent amidase/aminoacylase/carboxypeptidase family protein